VAWAVVADNRVTIVTRRRRVMAGIYDESGVLPVECL